MSKIISLFQIKSGFALNILKQKTQEEQDEYINFAKRALKEIEAMVENSCGCTCDMCHAWERYEGEKEAFTANGGYLGFCNVWQANTTEGDFCSESWMKQYYEN